MRFVNFTPFTKIEVSVQKKYRLLFQYSKYLAIIIKIEAYLMLFADNLNPSGTKEKGCKMGKNRDFDSVQREALQYLFT